MIIKLNETLDVDNTHIGKYLMSDIKKLATMSKSEFIQNQDKFSDFIIENNGTADAVADIVHGKIYLSDKFFDHDGNIKLYILVHECMHFITTTISTSSKYDKVMQAIWNLALEQRTSATVDFVFDKNADEIITDLLTHFILKEILYLKRFPLWYTIAHNLYYEIDDINEYGDLVKYLPETHIEPTDELQMYYDIIQSDYELAKRNGWVDKYNKLKVHYQ